MAKPTDDYYAQLGHFTQLFAETEWLIRRLLWESAGISDDMGRAVLSGIKIDQAPSLIRRAITVAPVPADEAQDLEYVFDQLALINDVRNLIVHHGAAGVDEEGGPRLTTDRLVAMKGRAPREVPVSATTIAAMNHDLLKIDAHITWRHLIQVIVRRSKLDERRKLAIEKSHDAVMPLLLKPWRYKSHVPKPPAKESKADRKAHRKQLVRQRSALPK